MESSVQSGVNETYSATHSHVVGSVIVVVSLISLFETSTILWVISKNKDMFGSSYHILIGNLMGSDLLVSIMGLFFRGPGLISETFAASEFLFTLCKFVPFLTWAGVYASSLAVLCITYNRMLALSDPVKYKMGITRVISYKMVFYTWLVVSVYTVTATVIFNGQIIETTFEHSCVMQCAEVHGTILIIAFDTTFFVLPLLGIISMYLKIVGVLSRDKFPQPSRVDNARKIAIFRNISLLLFFFTISWLPNYIYNLYRMTHQETLGRKDHPQMYLDDVVVILFYSNLLIDPIVYVLGSRDFREKMSLVLRKRIRKASLDLSRTSGEWTRRISQVSSSITPGSRMSKQSGGGVILVKTDPHAVRIPREPWVHGGKGETFGPPTLLRVPATA